MATAQETIEDHNTVPIVKHYDLIVVGSGPSGIGAAISAGRMGVKVLIIEQSGNLGGVSTSGLMSHWTGDTRGGIYDEIIERSKDSKDPNMRVFINPEKLKTVYLEMAQEAHVDVLLYTFASKPILENGAITGVIVENKTGRQAYMAKYVIDCSGDGDIAARAGAPYTKGRERDGKMQPATLMMKVGGVDTAHAVFIGAFEDDYVTAEGSLQALGRKYIDAPAGHVLLYRSTLPGIVNCNMTNAINIDGTNADDLTKATIICRHQTMQIVNFLRDHVPGYENCYLLESAAQIGIRETRIFKTQYMLTPEDIKNSRLFPDWIVGSAQFSLDIHNIEGNGLDKEGQQKHFHDKKGGYTIPLGCIIPQKVKHLLVGGRIIGATHIANSSLRAMPICANIGQGCGIVAALLIQGRLSLDHPDLTPLHDEIKKREQMLADSIAAKAAAAK